MGLISSPPGCIHDYRLHFDLVAHLRSKKMSRFFACRDAVIQIFYQTILFFIHFFSFQGQRTWNVVACFPFARDELSRHIESQWLADRQSTCLEKQDLL